MCRSQACRRGRQAVQAVMKCVKASLGTTRTTCLWRRSGASACSGGLFTTRWHSRELRQRDRWWVWSEDVFNQQDSASLQHGRYYSQKGWKIEKNGICRFPRGLGLKWTGETVFVWLMRHICVFWRGNYPRLFRWNKCVAMCTPATKMIETKDLCPWRDDLWVGCHVSHTPVMIYCSIWETDFI